MQPKYARLLIGCPGDHMTHISASYWPTWLASAHTCPWMFNTITATGGRLFHIWHNTVSRGNTVITFLSESTVCCELREGRVSSSLSSCSLYCTVWGILGVGDCESQWVGDCESLCGGLKVCVGTVRVSGGLWEFVWGTVRVCVGDCES